jgi:hypothetical protein
MQHIADVDLSGGRSRTLDLCMTAQTEIGIALREQFSIQRSVRAVTDSATFAQRFVLENHGPGLFAMTLRAAFVPMGHRQSAPGFEDVAAMRIVALHTIHPPFEDRMMLRQMKLAFDFDVALETNGRVLAWIDDEFGPAAGLDVFAAGAVAGFATGAAGHGVPARISARMRTGRKCRDNGGMAIRACLVSHCMGAGNAQRNVDRPVRRA